VGPAPSGLGPTELGPSKLKRLYYKGFSLLACLFALGPVMMLTGMEAGS
jgi:hypothetical protein